MANSTVQFDEKGDGLARYRIFNYQKKNGGSGYDYKVSFTLVILIIEFLAIGMRLSELLFHSYVISILALNYSHSSKRKLPNSAHGMAGVLF